MRRIVVLIALASLALTVLTAAAVAAGAFLLRDLGPLPPRYSGPPLPRETVVSEMTSILAAEGITVAREPSGGIRTCHERLAGQHAPETVQAALKAAFERARSEHGWQTGPDLGEDVLTLKKNNWTVTSGFASTPPTGLPAMVIVSMTCIDGDPTTDPTAPSAPPVEPVPASS
ncbi:hypothetical protein [Streptomyces virginiae]